MPLADQIRAGDQRAIARALSAIENGESSSRVLMAELGERGGRAYVIGITGAPGAGKSTLADQVVTTLRKAGSTVGVLAVDPSSPFTGGAVLGDRVRMQAHAGDAGVFIRSMASRGQLGGLARATAEAATVLAAAGFDIVLIETVGVGQAEVDIARIADISVVVVAPGAGDDVQALKAGLMEIADIFVVNKADREGADRAAASITGMLALHSWPSAAWQPPVLRTVATTGEGVPALVDAIGEFRHRNIDTGRKSRLEGGSDAVVLDHVGVAIKDAAGLAKVLHDLLGLATDPPEPLGAHQLSFVQTGSTTVELVEPQSSESPVAKFLGSRSSGLHHLCFRVRDIDATLAALKAKGVRLVDEVPRPGAHGSRIAFLHPSSTGGILIELKQPRNH